MSELRTSLYVNEDDLNDLTSLNCMCEQKSLILSSCVAWLLYFVEYPHAELPEFVNNPCGAPVVVAVVAIIAFGDTRGDHDWQCWIGEGLPHLMHKPTTRTEQFTEHFTAEQSVKIHTSKVSQIQEDLQLTVLVLTAAAPIECRRSKCLWHCNTCSR